MVSAIEEAARTNAETAKQVILRSAEIMDIPEEHQQERTPVVEAVRKAWMEFLDGESKTHREKRTYHRAQMINDIKWHVAVPRGADGSSLHPIHDWEQTLSPATVAETLKEAAEDIAEEVRQRTITAGRLGMMSDEQIAEHMLMRETKRFLGQQGLEVEIEERDDPGAPIDYRGTVNGTRWAFELTRLRDDPKLEVEIEDRDDPKKGFHRKLGHPKERKSLYEQLDDLQQPLPCIPDGPEALQGNLVKAVRHGQIPGKLKALDGAKYCLVIHNQQFTFAPDWTQLEWPDLEDFDAVMIFHDQMILPGRIWEVIKDDGFGRTLTGGTVDDLETAASDRETWARLNNTGTTEENVVEAIREVREGGCHREG